MRVKYTSTNLPFVHPFTISKGTKTHQPALVVQLEHLGLTGIGEAPAIAYYNIPVEKMLADLGAKKMFVEKFAFTEPGRYWHYLHHLFPQNGFLVCALDIAAWDLYGKMKRKPLHTFWSKGDEQLPLTDFTIGIDTIEKMVAKMEEKPWPVYKIKLGTQEDIAIMEALRKHTNALFRIDANAGWTVQEALEKIHVFKDLGVELIEQPLAKDDWEGMKQLYNESPIPLIADESCVYEQDVAKCEGHFHGINIKLTKCTGITPALRMIEDARKRNMKIMVGSMNEGSIGSAAIVHLMPLVDYVDVDGPLLLAEDNATGLVYDYGKVTLPQIPGLGIQSGLFQ
ncbi:MAG TPA: dipeptide epimerase [Phnomibacter sp.]|nr:dipeptide epimerase [Phnomibacter sp.]